MRHKKYVIKGFQNDKYPYRWLFPLSLFILLFSLSACSSANNEVSQQPEPEPSITETQAPSSSEQSEAPETVYEEEPVLPISLVDHVGDEITIGSVERIIPLDEFSISLIIVDPVVVSPETDSKKASVKLKFCVDVIKGNEANIDRENQLNTTSIKALFTSILIVFPLFIKIKDIPIKKVKTLLTKKPIQF